MKSVTVCVIFCAIALLSFHRGEDCSKSGQREVPQRPPNVVSHGPGSNFTRMTDESLFTAQNFNDSLRQYQLELAHNITHDAFRPCIDAYRVSKDERLDLFSSTELDNDSSLISYSRKCLANCTMHEMGVLYGQSFDVAAYIQQIKILRLNYTSFDATKASNRIKNMISEVVGSQVEDLLKQDGCGKLSDTSRMNDTDATLNRKHSSDVCSKLIESYELAAIECKEEEEHCSEGCEGICDSCELAWKILKCIKASHRKRSFAAPFYPVPGPLSIYQDEELVAAEPTKSSVS